MKALVQRVNHATVRVENEVVGEIGHGLLVLLCVEQGDSHTEADYIAHKLQGLCIFGDEAGKMNRSVKDIDGSLLVVSQFTLAGKLEKGFRPSFMDAAPPDTAEELFVYCVEKLRTEYGVPVQTGKFRTYMKVSFENDGPVTLMLEKGPAQVGGPSEIGE
jgi:D-tyrosyl-tRNA(Tyr) deacylase